DAEYVRLVKVLGNDGDHLARQLDVFRFLGVDAQPAVMADAKLGGPFGLDLGEGPEVIAKPFPRAAIEPGPKRRLADGHAPALGHAVIVVGDAGDHVDVGVDVVHLGRNLRPKARFPSKGPRIIFTVRQYQFIAAPPPLRIPQWRAARNKLL